MLSEPHCQEHAVSTPVVGNLLVEFLMRPDDSAAGADCYRGTDARCAGWQSGGGRWAEILSRVRCMCNGVEAAPQHYSSAALAPLAASGCCGLQ